jgi:hypothetical protein
MHAIPCWPAPRPIGARPRRRRPALFSRRRARCAIIRRIMFELLRLEWNLRSAKRSFAKSFKELKKRKASRDEYLELDADEYYQIQFAEDAIDIEVGSRLLHEARALDVDTPPTSDDEMWVHSNDGPGLWLTPKGRATVRRAIDEERSRRFDVKTRWLIRLIIPLAGVLVDIIGALTGLFAVLRHAK